MFLRFIGLEIDLRTGKRKGIFTLAYDLIDSNNLLEHEEDYLRSLLIWFKQSLPVPTKFSKNRNDSHKENISTSWFKDSATEIISKIREIQLILENNEIFVEVQQSKKPGYIIYEDEFQIVVDPF